MMFAVLGEVPQTHLQGNFYVTENSQKVRRKSLYKNEDPCSPKRIYKIKISFIPVGLVHVFLCNLVIFPILVKSLSVLIQAQPDEEFSFSFHQPVTGKERKRVSKTEL